MILFMCKKDFLDSTFSVHDLLSGNVWFLDSLLVLFTYDDAGGGDDEDEDVSAEGIVVGAISGGKEVQAGVEVVLGQGLEDAKCAR